MFIFISNDFKTEFHIRIAKFIQEAGHQVLFIAFNSHWQKRIETAGYSCERISFSETVQQGRGSPPAPEFPIHDLVEQDHALRGRKEGGDYLKGVYKRFRSIVEQHKTNSGPNIPIVCVGESSRGHETLMMRACGEFKCAHYLIACTARYPGNRFFLFDDEYQRSWIRPSDNTLSPGDSGKEQSEEPLYFKTTLRYLESKNRLLAYIAKGLKLFYTDIYDTEDVHFSRGLPSFVANRLNFQWNRLIYKYLIKKNSPNLSQHFALFALQRDPESTVDVLGRCYTDQLALIRVIANSLPKDNKLYVKEHRTAIGDRGFSFYRKLREIPAVVLIDERVSAKSLIEQSLAVFSVSGTVTIEAFFSGVPAGIFSDIYLNKLNSVRSLNPSDFREGMPAVINRIRSDHGISIEDYDRFIHNNTFEGRIGDHLTEPETIEQTNLVQVSKALLATYSGLNNEDHET